MSEGRGFMRHKIAPKSYSPALNPPRALRTHNAHRKRRPQLGELRHEAVQRSTRLATAPRWHAHAPFADGGPRGLGRFSTIPSSAICQPRNAQRPRSPKAPVARCPLLGSPWVAIQLAPEFVVRLGGWACVRTGRYRGGTGAETGRRRGGDVHRITHTACGARPRCARTARPRTSR
jgi:hypothetical protein